VLLYEMVSGRVPFDARTIGRLVEQISKGDYTSPSLLKPGVPRELESIIARCLKKNPAARYASARDLLEDLRQAMAAIDPSTSQPAPQTVAAATLWLRSNWQMLTIAAMGLIIIALLIALVTSGPGAPQQAVTPQQSSHAAAVAAPAPVAAPATSSEMRTIRINTLEGRAEVYRDGQMVGTTPYEISAPLGVRVRLTLKRDGYQDEPLDFTITEN